MKTIIIGAIMASFWAFAQHDSKQPENLAQHAASAIVTSK